MPTSECQEFIVMERNKREVIHLKVIAQARRKEEEISIGMILSCVAIEKCDYCISCIVHFNL